MERVKVKVHSEAEVNGHGVDEILSKAAKLAHCVLEELSVHRQRTGCGEFGCEAAACELLDLLGD